MCLAALAIVLTLSLPTGAPARPDAAARVSALRFVSLAPVRVRGSGFVPREDVRVTLVVGRRSIVRTARADGSGVFTVSFGLVALDPCRGAAVARVVGSHGSRAIRRRECRPPDPVPSLYRPCGLAIAR